MVERGGLENRCTARYRGFESLTLCSPGKNAGVFLLLKTRPGMGFSELGKAFPHRTNSHSPKPFDLPVSKSPKSAPSKPDTKQLIVNLDLDIVVKVMGG